MTALIRRPADMPDGPAGRLEPIEPRYLPFRLHDHRPANGPQFTEWCIETQLALAFDSDDPDAYLVLAAFNPAREGQILDRIGQLLDLSAAVRDAEDNLSTAAFHAAIDDYRDGLYEFSRTLRGAK